MLHIDFFPLATQMGIYLLLVMQSLVWHRLIKWCFIQRHTFQHCSNTLKLNKCAKYLNLAINNQQCGQNRIQAFKHVPKSISLQHYCVRYQPLACLFLSFRDMRLIWQHLNIQCLTCSIVVPGYSYEQCCAQLLKVLHKCCNTDVLGVLVIYLHYPSGTLGSCAYISVKPLAAV